MQAITLHSLEILFDTLGSVYYAISIGQKERIEKVRVEN